MEVGTESSPGHSLLSPRDISTRDKSHAGEYSCPVELYTHMELEDYYRLMCLWFADLITYDVHD
jgi:hypothetical protein